MNTLRAHAPRILAFAAFLLCPIAAMHAGTFSADFNDGNVPDGSAVFGSANIAGSGGFTNSPCLDLTPAAASQVGVFIVTSNLDGATPVVSFTANFRM